ncbi:MAG: response regulator, partial [Pseudoxanthomonas sp.]
DHGIEIVGPAATLAHALEVAESGSFDVAMLDVNLGCETSFPVARVLRERGIPFFYTTAFANTAHPDIAGEVFLPKPYGIKDLLETLRQVLPARSKRDS